MSPAHMSRAEEGVRVAADYAAAFNRHDAGGIVELCGDDCVFEGYREGAEGGRLLGKPAVAAFLGRVFSEPGDVHLVVEELVGVGPRCFLRWRLEREGEAPLRGIDVFEVRMGRIREKLSYARLP